MFQIGLIKRHIIDLVQFRVMSGVLHHLINTFNTHHRLRLFGQRQREIS
ncbi:Uncharacterised protein [Vibrio cholerae]|nr:Uncharacterised protein [Vibrio cholerae]